MRSLAFVPLCVVLPLVACGQTATDVDQSPADASPGADSSDGSASDSSAETRVLFELSRSSYAKQGFGRTWFGVYVTSKGEVYRYEGDYDMGAPTPCFTWEGVSSGLTEEQLTDHSNTKLVGTLNQDDVLAHFALVDEVRLGSLLVQPGCSDCNLTRYEAYTYDDATSTYSTVPLGFDGDLALRNTSQRAEELIGWLRDNLDFSEERCAFETTSCGGTLCPGVDACTDGTVPISPSTQGCMQECGAPSLCDQVADCSVCTTAGAACVTDQDGMYHCVESMPGCDGEIGCSCGGAGLCGGGAAYCQGTAEEGLRCSAP